MTTVIHPPGKIDIHGRAKQYENAIEKLRVDKTLDPENREMILKFLRDCRLGKTLKGRARKKIGPARCLKYLGILKLLSAAFAKPFDLVTMDDMEGFVEGLEADRLLTKKGTPFSEASKSDIRKAIKKFWKWKDGACRHYPDLVEWIETCEPVKEVPALSRREIERIVDATASPRDRALIMLLFDSGARIEELLNVRLKAEHLFWKESAGCYMIRLEFSKTKPRTISIPLSTKVLRSWLEVHPFSSNPDAQLFPMSYPSVRAQIARAAKKALGKRVTAHMLRHSSATYYANMIKNRYKLCYRYGWAMSSDMVDRYLDREGLMEEETAEAVIGDEVSKAKTENVKLKEELVLMKETHEDLLARFEKLESQLSGLESGRGIMSMLLRQVAVKSRTDEGVSVGMVMRD